MLHPILHWAGGKTQLLEQIMSSMPEHYNDYYEPFLGGGAVLLGVAPKKAYVNDINPQLINLYIQLKLDVQDVLKRIDALDAVPCDQEYYNSIRYLYNKKITQKKFDSECAAFMVWINKHCFNGLYRVNDKGLFNVPWNNKTNVQSINKDNCKAVADYLKNNDITITCIDFENACTNVKAGDFVYFDSPYVPESPTASFTGYTKGGFTLANHERLAALFRRLDSIGVKLMLSNNDVPLVRKLYSGFNIQSFHAKRSINRDASKRTGKEVIIRNYS